MAEHGVTAVLQLNSEDRWADGKSSPAGKKRQDNWMCVANPGRLERMKQWWQVEKKTGT